MRKKGAAARAEHPNELAAGVRGDETLAAGETAEQVFDEAATGEALVARLEADYPELRFRAGKRFMFRPPRTVVYEGFLEGRRGNGDYEEGADEAFDGGRGSWNGGYSCCMRSGMRCRGIGIFGRIRSGFGWSGRRGSGRGSWRSGIERRAIIYIMMRISSRRRWILIGTGCIGGRRVRSAG